MCGFAGFWSRHSQRDSEDTLRAMTNVIAHRGPDDEGAWCSNAVGVALGHRRLSIVDLSPQGHQPMASAGGRYQIIFNGEIYNHLEIRQELLAFGDGFRGHSDTEVMLAAIARWGLDASLERFVGMFAFALWDEQTNTLALVRDRFGEKPLYFAQVSGTLLFGSELKALQRHPQWHGEIDRDALSLYFRHNYLPAPYTIYRNVRKVVPGTIVQFSGSADAPPSTRVYWSARRVAEMGTTNPLEGSDESITEALDQTLRRAVRQQMVADVPLGAFLSGGVDSSLVVALMQAQSDRPVRTFTIGFHEQGYNEAEHARAVAQHLGTSHTEAYVTPEEARAVIPRLPTLYDEPFADSSQIPTFLVAQLARQHVTVSLSGDGGDELFAGYGRYAELERLWRRLDSMPRTVRRLSSDGLRRLAASRWHAGLTQGRLLPSRGRRLMQRDNLGRMSRALSATSPEQLYRELVSYWATPQELVPSAIEPRSAFASDAGWGVVQGSTARAMLLDSVSYLPDDILVKVDRATMGVSLESRAPLLDHRVAELAWRIPHRLKVRGGQPKWILRHLLHRYVPPALVDRPKMGFGVPVGQWLRGPLRGWAEELLSPRRIAEEGLLDPEAVTLCWKEHLHGRNQEGRLWGILMFQAWLAEQRAYRAQPAGRQRAAQPIVLTGDD